MTKVIHRNGIEYQIERWGAEGRRLKIRAVDSKGEAGVFEAYADPETSVLAVETIGIEQKYHRKGIGTAFYEIAARTGCEELDRPLQSGYARSGYSQAFWEKQVAKGRATCIREEVSRSGPIDSIKIGRGGCYAYQLSCPAPESLAKSRRRRKSR